MAGTKPVHEALTPLAWLIGSWKTEEGIGFYPTIKDFRYVEQLDFTHMGQPNIHFSFCSYDETGTKPMHREVGFLRIKPGTNQVAYISAHNMGLADMEEGSVKDNELSLSSTNIGRMSFGTTPAVQQIVRTFSRHGDELVQTLGMATSNTSLTGHLKARYKLQS